MRSVLGGFSLHSKVCQIADSSYVTHQDSSQLTGGPGSCYSRLLSSTSDQMNHFILMLFSIALVIFQLCLSWLSCYIEANLSSTAFFEQ